MSWRELVLWVALAISLCFEARPLDSIGFLEFLASINIVSSFSWFVFFRSLVRTRNQPNLDMHHLLILTAILFLNLLVAIFGLPIAPAILALAIYFISIPRKDDDLRSATIVLAALALHIGVAPYIYQLIVPEILLADSFLFSQFLKAIGSSIVSRSTTFFVPGELTATLVGSCSSFQNISVASLAVVSYSMLKRPYLTKKDFVFLLFSTCAIVLFNDTRLALTIASRESYFFWHNGSGSSLLSAILNALLLVLAVTGERFGRRA